MSVTVPYILMIGCFDTKGEIFAFLRDQLLSRGERVLTLNTGVLGTTDIFPVDIDAEAVATAGRHTLEALRTKSDRGYAVDVMGKGVAKIVSSLVAKGGMKGAIGMGGGGGTYIVLSGLKEIPMGIPKVCVSTLAAKDLTRQMESKDIVLIPSIVDVAGLNSISEMIISQAAAAISAMVRLPAPSEGKSIGRVAISMFGNTTPCVDQCTKFLQSDGYEVFAFHANGQGGRTMEALIRENYFDGVLEITTTELADELCGGICSAGPERMNAAAEMAIPQVILPGCLDMVNFGPMDTVPEKYRHRQLYSWAPDVTLMRTDKEENIQLGEILGGKINQSFGPVIVLLPERGLSQLDDQGKEFYNPEVNRVLFDSIKRKVKEPVTVIEFDGHINEHLCAELAVNALQLMMEERGEPNDNRDFKIGNYDV